MKFIKTYESAKYLYKNVSHFNFSLDIDDEYEYIDPNIILVFLDKKNKNFIIESFHLFFNDSDTFIKELAKFNLKNNIELDKYIIVNYISPSIYSIYDYQVYMSDTYDLELYKDNIDKYKENYICLAISEENINTKKLEELIDESYILYNSLKYNI
jgi:hypothetical protein